MNNYNMSEEESIRLHIIKYIAIVFVVYIHAYATYMNFAEGTSNLLLPNWLLLFEDLVSQVIARCGVPIFFLISSILLYKKQRTYRETIKNKIKTILIPYIIWNTLWILVFIILQSSSITASYFSGNNTPILQSSISEWFGLYGIGAEYPQDYPLWFMRDLMVVMLVYPIIGNIAKRFSKQLLVISVIMLLLPISFPFKTSLLWFCIGACIINLQIHITLLDYVAIWKMILVYVVCAIVTLLTEYSIIDNMFIFVGILFWTRVTKCIYESDKWKKVFLVLAQSTFIIYVLHELTLTCLKKVCIRLLPTSPLWLLVEYLILPIVVIIGCSIAGVVFKRIAPKLYNISTGSR